VLHDATWPAQLVPGLRFQVVTAIADALIANIATPRRALNRFVILFSVER
jgi:hypothetical protein